MGRVSVPRLADRAGSRLPPVDAAAIWVVLVLAFAAGVWLWLDYWPNAGSLWWGSQHDRNAHYLQCLTLATSVRAGDWFSFFSALESLDIWGVAHPVLSGIVQLVAGPDHRLAVVPSFVMWMGSIVCSFVLARRVAPAFSVVAGLIAAMCIAASPAHRAFAVDSMLESGGAFLTLAALGAYLKLARERSPRAASGFVIVCLSLFFWKYNYWLLVILAIAVAEAVGRRREWWTGASNAVRAAGSALRMPRGRLAKGMFAWLARNSLLLIAAAILVFGVIVLFRGPTTLSLGSWAPSFTRHHGIMHAGWIILSIHAAIWWRRSGRAALARRSSSDRIVALGLAIPIGIWFLIPKRLGGFLWFLSPLNSDQPANATSLSGVRRYVEFIATDYFTQPWLVPMAAVLTLIALVGVLRSRREAMVLFVLLGVAAALTFDHPMVKARFLHSWIGVLYLTAGIGVDVLLNMLHARSVMLARAAAGIVIGLLACFLAPAFVTRGHAQESGLRADAASTLDLTTPLVQLLPTGKSTQLVSNEAECWTLQWAVLEKLRVPSLISLDIKGYRRTQRDPAALTPWLANTPCEVIAIIDVPNHSPFFTGYGGIDLGPVRAVLSSDPRFEITSDRTLTHGERITVWQRRP